MMRGSNRRWLAALLLVPALLLVGCGDDDDDASTDDTTEESGDGSGDTTTTAAQDETSTTAADGDETTTTGEPAEVEVLPSALIGVAETEYGEVLTAPNGKTLYIFDEDTDGEPTCVGECAAKWPPVYAQAAELADGTLEGIELATVDTPDGHPQVTVNGRPVYTMEADQPGEALCQGGDDVWWIVAPDGEPNRDLEPVAG